MTGQFDSLEEALKNPEEARMLNFAVQDEVVITSDVAKLVNLEEINLDAVQSLKLPDEILQMKQIKHVKMSMSGKNVFEEVKKLSHLLSLSVSGNTWVGDVTFDAFADLEELNISRCSLMKIPAGVLELTKLRQLFADDNAIESISDLKRMKQLEVLTLRENCLSSVMDTLRELPNLRIVQLSGNDIEKDEISGFVSFAEERGIQSDLLS